MAAVFQGPRSALKTVLRFHGIMSVARVLLAQTLPPNYAPNVFHGILEIPAQQFRVTSSVLPDAIAVIPEYFCYPRERSIGEWRVLTSGTSLDSQIRTVKPRKLAPRNWQLSFSYPRPGSRIARDCKPSLRGEPVDPGPAAARCDCHSIRDAFTRLFTARERLPEECFTADPRNVELALARDINDPRRARFHRPLCG